MTTKMADTERRMTAAQRIADAGEAVAAARDRRDAEGILAAEHDLRVAVDAGRVAGLTWGCIANALGIRRGSAYQRYRERPATPIRPAYRSAS